MITTRLERRVLGAVQFVDATTGAAIGRALRVESDARVYRQRSGLLVVADAPGLHEHTLTFAAPPAAPAPGSVPVELHISDPGRQYQSTTVTLALPRSPDPNAGNSVLNPQQIKLWRTGAAPLAPGWTVYQITLLATGTEIPVVGALISLEAAGQMVQALTDATGQATLALVGQPLFALDGGANLTRSLAGVIKVRLNKPAAALADVEAEISRLTANPVAATFNRNVLTGAATHEVLAVDP
jgi:hypothetical protein